MKWEEIGSNIFSLRDILSYLLPGVISILAIEIAFSSFLEELLMDVSYYQEITDNIFTVIILYFFISYFMGFLCNLIARKFLFDCLGKDPFDEILSSSYFSSIFMQKLRSKIANRLGEDFLEEETDKNIIYLCWRYIQNFNHHIGFSYLFRLVTLFDMCASLCIASFLLSIVLLGNRYFIMGAIGILFSGVLYRGYYKYRKEFGKNILRIFYIIEKRRN